MITLDTSGLFALLNRKDPNHKPVKAALLRDSGPYLVPAGILAEAAYLVERRLGTRVLEGFILDLESGGFALESSSLHSPSKVPGVQSTRRSGRPPSGRCGP